MPSLVVATGNLLEEILDETFPQWGDGLTRKSYAQWNAAQMRTPWGRQHLHRVALVERGERLASAKRYDFSMRVDDRTVRALGIGAVFTPPALRGRGHARQLIELMCGQARDEGVEAALLFSEIGTPYYQSMGFVRVPVQTADITMELKGGAPAVLVRAGEERDAASVSAMHVRRLEHYGLGLVTDADLVNYSVSKKRMLVGLDQARRRAVEYFVVEEGHQAVAFVLIFVIRPERDHEPELWSLEACGDRDPSGARIGAMLQVLAARMPAERTPRIRAWWPEGFRPPQLTITSRAPAAEVMMIRDLSGTRLAPTAPPRPVLYWHGDAF